MEALDTAKRAYPVGAKIVCTWQEKSFVAPIGGHAYKEDSNKQILYLIEVSHVPPVMQESGVQVASFDPNFSVWAPSLVTALETADMCPSCEKRPIISGDYLCEECR